MKKTATKKQPARRSPSGMTEEQVFATFLGPAGKKLYKQHKALKASIDGVDDKNPTPQSVARAAKGLTEIIDTLIWCIQINAGIGNLQSALDRARPHLSSSEISGMEKTLADARKWVSENCGGKSPQ